MWRGILVAKSLSSITPAVVLVHKWVYLPKGQICHLIVTPDSYLHWAILGQIFNFQPTESVNSKSFCDKSWATSIHIDNKARYYQQGEDIGTSVLSERRRGCS